MKIITTDPKTKVGQPVTHKNPRFYYRERGRDIIFDKRGEVCGVGEEYPAQLQIWGSLKREESLGYPMVVIEFDEDDIKVLKKIFNG